MTCQPAATAYPTDGSSLFRREHSEPAAYVGWENPSDTPGGWPSSGANVGGLTAGMANMALGASTWSSEDISMVGAPAPARGSWPPSPGWPPRQGFFFCFLLYGRRIDPWFENMFTRFHTSNFGMMFSFSKHFSLIILFSPIFK